MRAANNSLTMIVTRRSARSVDQLLENGLAYCYVREGLPVVLARSPRVEETVARRRHRLVDDAPAVLLDEGFLQPRYRLSRWCRLDVGPLVAATSSWPGLPAVISATMGFTNRASTNDTPPSIASRPLASAASAAIGLTDGWLDLRCKGPAGPHCPHLGKGDRSQVGITDHRGAADRVVDRGPGAQATHIHHPRVLVILPPAPAPPGRRERRAARPRSRSRFQAAPSSNLPRGPGTQASGPLRPARRGRASQTATATSTSDTVGTGRRAQRRAAARRGEPTYAPVSRPGLDTVWQGPSRHLDHILGRENVRHKPPSRPAPPTGGA